MSRCQESWRSSWHTWSSNLKWSWRVWDLFGIFKWPKQELHDNFLISMMKAVFSNLHRPFNQPGWFSWSSDFKLNFWKSLAQRVRLSRIFCLAFAGPLTRLANRPDFPGNLNSFEFHQNLQIATMPSRDLTPSAFWCFEMRITKHWKFSIKTMFHANSNNVTKVKHRLVNKIGL